MPLRVLSVLVLAPLLGLLAACDASPGEDDPGEDSSGWDTYGEDQDGLVAIPKEDLIPEDAVEYCEENCERLCPDLQEEITCRVDIQGGDIECQGAPVELHSTNGLGGMVLKIDMSAHRVLVVDVDVNNPQDWLVNLGDSPTNNGNAGDGASTSHDSEIQLVDTHLALFRSDYGSNLKTISEPSSIAAEGDTATMTVCDGAFAFSSSVYEVGVTDPAIFQIDGDEEDVERQATNDRFLWLGVEQVIAGGSDRTGDGVADLWLTFGS